MNEIYESVGSLVQLVQYIEYNLVEIVRLRRILSVFDHKNSVPNQVFEQAESEAEELRESLSDKTLGAVIKTVKKYNALNDNQLEELEKILRKRNNLVHHFFKENDFEEQSENIKFMINRKGYLANFLSQTEQFNSIIIKILDGLNEEYVEIE